MTKRKNIPGPKRPVMRYHGGKFRMAPWIVSQMPPHERYVEAFGGGAGVLLRKEPTVCDVYNDTNQEIVNVFRVLRDPETAEQLRRVCTLTPYARAEHDLSYEDCDDPVERARRTLFRSYSSFAGASRHRAAIRPPLGARGNRPELDWRGWPASVPAFTLRLSTVFLESIDALALIDKYDREDTLFYCDPPYPHSTRAMVNRQSHFHYGAHEMTDDDHRRVAARLSRARGPVLVSGYHCPLYDDELYAAWDMREKHAAVNGGRAAVEVLWIKPAGVRHHVSNDALIQPSFLDDQAGGRDDGR